MRARAKNGMAVASLLLGLLCVGWWIGAQRPATSAASELPLPKSITESVSGNAPFARHASETTTAPAQQILQSDRYAQLSGAAANDPEAAYLLAQGMEACVRLRALQWELDIWLKEPTLSNSQSDIAAAAEQVATQKLVDATRARCIGNTNVDKDQVSDALARAAQLGSQQAQYQYAIDPRLNSLTTMNDLERWRDWRDRAPGYLQSAAQRGDSNAVLTMAAASDQSGCHAQNLHSEHDPCAQGSIVGRILPQDAAIAYRYYLLYQLLGNDANAAWVQSQIASLQSLLSASEITDATAQAQQLYAQIHSAAP